jgi:threonyl-tRNA synthetase
VQVTVLPVADRHDEYGEKLVERFRAAGFRTEMIDAHADSLGARVRRAKLEKVPYVLVVGDSDVENGTVGVNARGAEQVERDVPVETFVERLTGEVADRVHA